MRSLLAVTLCGLAFASAHAQQTEPRVPWVLVRRGLDVRVDYDRATVFGTETLTVRNVSRRAVHDVPVLLNRLMRVTRARSERATRLEVAQRLVVFEDDSVMQVNAAVVRLPRAVLPGDTATVALEFGGRLVGYTETGSLYIRDHVDREFTILREDAFAFPALGLPAWSALRELTRAPFDFAASVTVPVGLVVATGGVSAEPVVRDSSVTWTYRSTAPVPFLNIAIAPYRLLQRDGLRVFHFPQDSVGADSLATAVGGAVRQLGSWFGPLGTEARLTIIEIPEGWGSQASLSGGIIQTADAFRSRSRRPPVYHELTHLWNVEDVERPSSRWNEGLAAFLQWRLAESLDGWSDWDARLQGIRETAARNCARLSACATTPMLRYGEAGLTDLSYSAGALMFAELYRTLGAESFDRAYRSFYQGNKARGGTVDDLVRAFVAVDARARGVFDRWMVTTSWQKVR